MWRRETGSATAAFVATRLDQLRDGLPLTKFKLAILRSFTVEPILPLLRAEAFAYGIDLEIHVGDFNTYVQEIVDAQSSLYRFAPSAVILAVRAEDVAPDLASTFADQSAEAAKQAADRVSRSCEQWVNSFRQHSQAALIIHSLERLTPASLGVLDSQTESGQSGLIRQINRELRRMAARSAASTSSTTTRSSRATAACIGTTNVNGKWRACPSPPIICSTWPASGCASSFHSPAAPPSV